MKQGSDDWPIPAAPRSPETPRERVRRALPAIAVALTLHAGMAWWLQHNAAEAAQFLDTIPLGRVGDCERDIGDFVVQLCSDACSYINGQSIGVDGGQALIA